MNMMNWGKISKISTVLIFIVPIPFAILFMNWPRGTSINGLVAGLIIVQVFFAVISSIAKRQKEKGVKKRVNREILENAN